MTTARNVIQNALRFHLNRLSPGETAADDDLDVCLAALNEIADEWNGQKSFLFREILTNGTVSGATGTLGVTWSTLVAGDEILGATVQYTAGQDVPISPITMAQYQQIPLKSTASFPQVYAHDGQATVYFYPAATGQTVTLRTKQIVSDFADLDTDYTMPKGYQSALSALLAEKVAPSLVGGVSPALMTAARNARSRIATQSINPAIPTGRPVRGNILAGW